MIINSSLTTQSVFFRRFEYCFAVIGLHIYTGGLLDPLARAGLFPDSLVQLSLVATYFISIALLAMRPKTLVLALRRNYFLFSLLLFTSASFIWSDSPITTLYFSVKLVGTSLFGIYLGVRFKSSEILQFLVYVFTFGALFSVLFSLVLPDYGTNQGSWNGIYRHKNFLGRLMILNVLFSSLLRPTKLSKRIFKKVVIGLSFSLILLSNSKGALTYFLIMVIISSILYYLLSLKDMIAIPLALIVMCITFFVALLTALNIEFLVTDLLGKDLTFTGRTDIWNACIYMLREKPLLGYGYAAFWRGLGSPSEYVLLRANWLAIPHAHNGFLDLSLEIGLLGLALFIISLLYNFLKIIIQTYRCHSKDFLWCFFYLMCIILFNISESEFLKNNTLAWVLYVTISSIVPLKNYACNKT